MTHELSFQGFKQSKSDYSLFIKRSGENITIVGVYVDDIIVTGNNDEEIQSLKAHLDKVLDIKDLGLLHFFL